jgi:Ca-activated chloride channel family protein
MRATASLRWIASVLVAASALLAGGCGRTTLTILSGSENESLEPIIRRFADDNRADIRMVYKGSVDIMLALQAGEPGADAVWPANGIWISLGDGERRVRLARSIMTSPVVFGVRRPLAERLGFVGRPVRVRDILTAIRAGELSFMMTSATQSNSGACAYLGFLSALLDTPDAVSADDLRGEALVRDIRDLLAGIDRSAGSSGWLKNLFLESDADAMVNYESMIIEANQELVKRGDEPLVVVYPVDGMVIADSPLGFIGEPGSPEEGLFRRLQEHLLSPAVQEELSRLGRRTSLGGVAGDGRAFDSAWGIDTDRILTSARLPSAEVISLALSLYQTDFRKPSLTVFCLDYSGSMNGTGVKQLREAMDLVLDPQAAAPYLLAPGRDDIVVVIPFSSRPLETWRVDGGDPAALADLRERIRRLSPGGSTDIYSPAIVGAELVRSEPDLDRYLAAVVLMSDGESNVGRSLADLRAAWDGVDVPVFGILFGEASPRQLEDIASFTRGRVFDGRSSLVGAFRAVRGYN